MNMISGRLLLLVLALLVVGGCSTTKVISREEPTFPPRFTREISPFTVLDSVGVEFVLPFQGGFNVPRSQFADMDDDGDPDLFVQEETGRIIYFENVGESGTPRFEWRTNKYGALDTGEWYRMVDMDGDGDIDVITEERFSYIRYYRNEGTAAVPDFVLAVDTLRDATGTPIFADRQNIPHIVDIDCDGLLDLFIGRVTGTITHYESVGQDGDNVPRFRFVTDRWEDIEIVGENMALHGANTMTFADIDSDGDLDLLWGDFFEAGLLLLRNRGSCGAPSLRGEPVSFPLNNPVATSGYNAPVAIDIDADGDMDVIFGVLGGAFNANATTRENFYFLEQVAPEKFEVKTTRFIYDIDVGSESVVKLFDMDADGDLDMIVANKIEPTNQRTSLMFLFENTGDRYQAEFRYKETLDLTGTYHHNPTFGDLDADGDLDILIGKWNKEIAFLKNEGSASEFSFVEANSVYVALTRGQNSTPALVDIDNDGDLDLFAGEASGVLNFWLNEGTPQEANFQLVSDTYLGIDVGRRSFPSFADLDGDGDYDMIIGSELGGLYLYVNQGTPEVADFVEWGIMDIDVQVISAPEFADIDNDGDLDLFVGGTSGGVLFFRNNSN